MSFICFVFFFFNSVDDNEDLPTTKLRDLQIKDPITDVEYGRTKM